ncbi:MAG: alpha/beta fold hydrolase [Pseudomonadota bacterium]
MNPRRTRARCLSPGPCPVALPFLFIGLLVCCAAASAGDDPCKPTTRTAEAWTETTGCIRVPLYYDEPDGGTLPLYYVRSQPRGTPAGRIIVFHGGPGFPSVRHPESGALWAGLRASFDIVYFHQRGAGRSGRLESLATLKRKRLGAFNLAAMTEDARTLHDALWGGEGRVILFGKSAGGFLALKFALAWPERTARVVLAATAAWHEYVSARDEVKARFMEELGRRFPGFAEALDRAKAKAPDGLLVQIGDREQRLSWTELEESVLFDLTYTLRGQYEAVSIVRQLADGGTSLLQERLDRGASVLRLDELSSEALFLVVACRELGWAQQQPAACLLAGTKRDPYDLRGRLAEVRVPVLVLSGAYDPVLPPRYQEEIAAGLRPEVLAGHVHMAHSAHMLFWEQPQASARRILGFLGLTPQQPPQARAP